MMAYYLFLLPMIFKFSLSENEFHLMSVAQLFRHGERTPVIFYPSDPYKHPSYWGGIKSGQLTKVGEHQIYALGEFFRNRYHNFLSDDISKNVLMKSSIAKRNFDSAALFLKGLCPDCEKNITIHRTGRSVLKGGMNCLKYIILHFKLTFAHEYFNEVEEANKKLYGYLSEHTGWNDIGLIKSFGVWDALIIEQRKNLALPEWTNNILPEHLEYVARNITYALCHTPELQRLGIGSFLNDLTEYFDDVIKKPQRTPKALFYSGHDLNLACLLNTFKAYSRFDYVVPTFASSIVFELWRNYGRFIIRGYYKPEDQLYPLKFRDCDFDCDYETFKNMFKEIQLDEWQWVKECLTIF